MSFEILTDAGANFIGNAVSRYRVPSVSFPCFVGGKFYRSINTSNARELRSLYREIRLSADVTTRFASEESYELLFEPVLKAGKDILYIGLSSMLSESFYIALRVANRLRERYSRRKICCFNSLAASMGQGMLVEYACELKERGMSVRKVYDALEEQKSRVRHLFTLDTPARLLREGKLKQLNYNLETSFNVRSIIGIDQNGKLNQIARAHGKARAITELAARVAHDIACPKEQTIYVAHTDCAEDAWALRQEISNRIPAKKIVVDYADPAFAAHTGSGALGVFYYASGR